MSSKKKVFIQIGEQLIVKKLNLEDSLSDIRNNINVIDNTLLFLEKKNDTFARIENENENEFFLKDIITVDNDQCILYLLKKPCWNVFNDNCKLDYGCTMSFDGIKKADKRAFIMKDCELTEINAEGYKKDFLEFESKEDWMKKTNLFFSSDLNVQNFVELGLSIEDTHKEKLNDEIKSSYKYTELGKMSLKFSKYLTPTEEFIKAVRNVNTDDPEEYRKITEEYGHFIPSEIILGGRVYFKNIKMFSESSVDESKKYSASASGGLSKLKIGYEFNNSEGKSKFHASNHTRVLGGKHPDGENFDEKAWIESLIDHQNWDCIEFKNPINIFLLLPDDLRKKSFETIGKKILYTCIKDCVYYLNKPGRYRNFELKLPQNVLEVILNKESGCDIFAAVVDTENSKNVFFSCYVLKPKVTEEDKPVKPRIIIHGVQKKYQPRKFKLKIKIMVVGIDLDFNFILPNIIKVEVIENSFNSKDNCDFYSMKLTPKCDLISENIPFFGIPILNDLNSNNSLVIGHKFCKAQADNELEIHTFSYCLKENRYVNLPEFTFYTLIILNNPTPGDYELLPFKFSRMKKKPFIDLQSQSSSLNPRYVSLYLSSKVNNNYKPFFLNQKIKQIKIKYVDCNCDEDCSFCKNKTQQRLSKNENNVECIVYNC
ncbi:unnamed protein product [Rhizophagus irregularis]|uniref:MACPF domain-containing protein n=1 Tax=Rhizophagus irregularis TaxID=588596 RepID=A0A916EHS9_9GLOM|nr:unnamed protein product [Rhizophagus irregularis]